MADASAMSTTGVHGAAPVLRCLFLNLLPTELRLLIYTMAFHGSRIYASLFKYKLPSIQTPALILQHSSHFNLLVSCRRIYDEALATFWSVTVLEFAQLLERSKILADKVFIEYKPDVYMEQLCCLLPKALKMNIRHIRGMLLPLLYVGLAPFNPSCTATALLSNFKNLATCEIEPIFGSRPWLPRSRLKLIEHPDSNGSNRFTIDRGPPKEHLDNYFGLDTTSKVVFLSKTLIKIPTSLKDRDQWSDPWSSNATRFFNLSTGKTCEVEGHNVDEEDGYEKVMGQVSNDVGESNP